MKCLNCEKEFTPSKNDKRIKFCSEECRRKYRRKSNYMKSYYEINKEKWDDRQNKQGYKNKKNQARREKYRDDEDYRNAAKERAKIYNLEHPEAKLRQHLSKFGITLDDYNSMLQKQNGKCAICGSAGNKRYKYRKLFVDHNHRTGTVRGLLCDRCNFMIGWADDNKDVLKNAIKYLEEYSDEG